RDRRGGRPPGGGTPTGIFLICGGPARARVTRESGREAVKGLFASTTEVRSMANTNLWRFRDDALALVDVARFEVRARDGSIGTVVQTIRRDGTSYLVVDPGASMPLGRSVLVPAGLIETIDVDERRLDVRDDRDQVSNAPEHDAQRDLDARTRGILERSEEHTSELQSQSNLVCRLLLEKKKL